jgi:hypothetical protein
VKSPPFLFRDASPHRVLTRCCLDDTLYDVCRRVRFLEAPPEPRNFLFVFTTDRRLRWSRMQLVRLKSFERLESTDLAPAEPTVCSPTKCPIVPLAPEEPPLGVHAIIRARDILSRCSRRSMSCTVVVQLILPFAALVYFVLCTSFEHCLLLI